MIPEETTHLVDSYATDLIHGIINERLITAKHSALSMGLQTRVLTSLVQILQEQRHASLQPVM